MAQDACAKLREHAWHWNGIAFSKATPLILIHGAGGQAMDWPYEWRERALALSALGLGPRTAPRWINERAVLACDLPGHGSAADTAPADTVEAYARAVAEQLAVIAAQPAIVCGHSMGGAIALELARRFPEKVAAIVVLGSAARLPVTPAILDGLQSDFAGTVAMIVKFCWARETGPFYRTVGQRRMHAAGAATVHGDFLACSRFDAQPWAGELKHPALVLSGSADRMVPADASRALADQLPNGSFALIDDAGHFFHVERPGPTAAAMRSFFAQHGL